MVSAPPSSSSLTPLGRLDPALINRAVHALLKHHSATSGESTSLFDNELDVQVQLSLLRIPGNSSPKPIRIDIPHSFLHLGGGSQDNDGEEDEEDVAMRDDAVSSSPPEICLIVKDSLKPTLQTLLSRAHPDSTSTLSCIKKILTLTSLRQKHKTFSQKRDLLAKYDLFLADDRILPMLSKALGKGFFHKKKQPLPICLTRNIGSGDRDATGLATRLDALLKATYLHLSSGTCLTVKAGTTSMSPERLVENIAAIAEKAPFKVPRKWANVRSISIKTTESVALPIYNKSPEEIEELLYLARVEKKEGVGGGEDTEEEKKKKKKRKEMAESTPLGKALKKQKSLEKKAKERNDEKPAEIKDDHDDTAVKDKETKKAETVEKEEEKGTARKAKKAKKERKNAEAVVVPPDDDANKDGDDDHEPIEEKLPTETPKSSKKKSKKKSKKEESDVEPTNEEKENHEQKTSENATPAKTPKSFKKRKEMKETNDESTAATPATSKTSDKSSTKKKSKEHKESKSGGDVDSSPTDAAFIPSKKFQGSKPGYVFRKDKKGLGYYKDAVPVVDEAWL